MKALTICQPYAHLILAGEKPVENRTWPTNYQGPLLIHAGKNRSWLMDGDEDRYPLVFGAIVGRVDLRGCHAIDFVRRQWPELADNKHVNGPFCWVLANPVRFETPIPWRGQQGLFEVPWRVPVVAS